MSNLSQDQLQVAAPAGDLLGRLWTRLRVRFHRDLTAGERLYLGSLLAFIAVTGVLLFSVTPVPFGALARGMSLYLMLPLISMSTVWGVLRIAELVAGHRFEIPHARMQWMAVTAIATSCSIPVYGLFKQYVLKDQGFPLDPFLAEADRYLFFGQDGWEVMHDLFDSVWFTLLLDRAYGFWLPILMFCPVLWAAIITDPWVRGRLIACWLAVWVLVGGVAAWLLASAGPMYYPHFIGPNPSFQALHDRIVTLGALARNQGEVLTTPIGHALLMKRYLSGHYMPGFGISAMPSVHVSMAALFAIGGYVIHRWLGRILLGYAVLIWIGSVYLGWHYALDGIVGAGLTYGIWKLSAKVAAPFAERAKSPD
ncbi:MAG: phosphatase PAP2 family protein [Chakrabartia sp.]